MISRQVLKIVKTDGMNNFTTCSRAAHNVAFIGTGLMGSQMAGHMVKKGSKVKVYDISMDAAKKIQGATVCKSPAEAAEGVPVIITMLPDGNVVKKTVLGENGIAKGIGKNALLVDCSTIAPKQAQELAQIAQEHNFRFLDSPVSGGVTGATAGTLTYMVGGNQDNIKDVEPYLLQAGKKIFYCGGPGAGQIAKLCNNLILGATMCATAESLNMGVKLGLDPQVLTDIINVSTGRSWSSETYNPVPNILPNVPSSKQYEGGFMVKLIAKDLGLAEGAALEANAPVMMTAIAHQMFRCMMNNGLGDKDFSVIYQFLQGMAKGK